MIAQGAGIIWSIDQFMNDLSEIYGHDISPKEQVPKSKKIKLTKEQEKIYELFDLYPKSLSQVVEETSIDYLQLMSNVLALERMGLLCEAFKNNYIKC